jgi:hypothetical protein
MWMGGVSPLGYRAEARKLIIVDSEAQTTPTAQPRLRHCMRSALAQ